MRSDCLSLIAREDLIDQNPKDFVDETNNSKKIYHISFYDGYGETVLFSIKHMLTEAGCNLRKWEDVERYHFFYIENNNVRAVKSSIDLDNMSEFHGHLWYHENGMYIAIDPETELSRMVDRDGYEVIDIV